MSESPIRLAPEPIESRAASGTVVGVISMLAGMIQSVIQVPILLHFWTPETYAGWMVVLALSSLFASLDLGHQSYLGNRFNRLWVENQPGLPVELSSGVRIAMLVAFMELGIGTALVATGALSSFSEPGNSGTTTGASIALLLYLMFWTVNGSVGGILVRLYPPAGLYSRGQWLGIFSRFVGFVALVAAVSLGAGLAEAMAAQVMAWALFNIYLYFDLLRRFPFIRSAIRNGDWSVGWRNFRLSLVLTANGVMEQLAGSGLVILVARFLAPAQVAVLTTMRTVANTAIQGTATLINPVVPDLVRFHVAGDGRKLSGAFATAWMLGGTVATGGFLASLWFVEPLYRHWTRGELGFDPELFATLVAAVSVRQWAAPLHAYLGGINRLSALSLTAALKVTGTLLLAMILLPRLGAAGAGWALLVGELLGASVATISTRRELNRHGQPFPLVPAADSGVQILVLSVGLLAFSQGLAVWPVFAGCCVLGTAGLGWKQWRGLPLEIRERAIIAAAGILRLKAS